MEFMSGALDPIVSILLCAVCAIAFVYWIQRNV